MFEAFRSHFESLSVRVSRWLRAEKHSIHRRNVKCWVYDPGLVPQTRLGTAHLLRRSVAVAFSDGKDVLALTILRVRRRGLCGAN
jgi:hypothetical protein